MAQIPADPALGPNVVTSGPVYRTILKLALPTVLAMLSQSVVNEIDILFFKFLPQTEASNAQAALLPSLIILWAFGGSLSAISVGTQAYTGRRFAAGRHRDAGAVLFNAATFSVVAGIAFTVLGYLSMEAIVNVVVKSEGVRESARLYLRWRLLGVTSMACTFALKAFFDGIGKTHIHLIASIAMNVLNVVLCWLLIFGTPSLGIPKLGIEGAGIAGAVATYTGLAVMVGYALKSEYRKTFGPFRPSMLDRRLVWDVVRLSVPSAVATIAVMTGFYLFVGIAGELDKLAAAAGTAEPVNGAATTVIVGVLKLTFTACLAFGTSTATLVSQCLGEKKGDRAATFGWASVRLGLMIFGVVGLVELVFAGPIIGFFTKSVLVQTAALTPMRMMGVFTPVIAVGMILTQALFGAGNTRFVMFAELVLHFVVFVPCAWLLALYLDKGLIGMWIAAAVYATGLAILMAVKFRSGDWKTIEL